MNRNHFKNMGEASQGVDPTRNHHWTSTVGFAKLSNYFFEQGVKIMDKPEMHERYTELTQALVAVRGDLQHVYHQEEHIHQLEYRLAEVLKRALTAEAEVEKLTQSINFGTD